MPTVLITGGHGGIGLECSKRLASNYHLNLILAGRSPERMEAVARELRAAYGVKVGTLELDTSSLASVRAAAARCRTMLASGETDSLQALVCNAGARFFNYDYSKDGYEMTFAGNYLGHFLLVELLFDCLAEDGRIVFTVSGTHDPDTVDGKIGAAAEPDAAMLANIGKDGKKPLSTGQLYSTSKLCMMLHAYELHRRLRKSGSSIVSIPFDPGGTSGTGFIRGLPRPLQWLFNSGLMNPLLRRFGVTMGSLAFSGESLARIAVDPAFAASSGKYLQSNDGKLIERRSSKMSYDEHRARKLWNDSKALVRLQPHEEPAPLR